MAVRAPIALGSLVARPTKVPYGDPKATGKRGPNLSEQRPSLSQECQIALAVRRDLVLLILSVKLSEPSCESIRSSEGFEVDG